MKTISLKQLDRIGVDLDQKFIFRCLFGDKRVPITVEMMKELADKGFNTLGWLQYLLSTRSHRAFVDSFFSSVRDLRAAEDAAWDNFRSSGVDIAGKRSDDPCFAHVKAVLSEIHQQKRLRRHELLVNILTQDKDAQQQKGVTQHGTSTRQGCLQ